MEELESLLQRRIEENRQYEIKEAVAKNQINSEMVHLKECVQQMQVALEAITDQSLKEKIVSMMPDLNLDLDLENPTVFAAKIQDAISQFSKFENYVVTLGMEMLS